VAYATVGELDAALGYTPTGAQQLLDRASRDIDQALLTAVYDVDSGGAATDPDVIAALRAAAIEQVAYQLELGNTSGIRHGMQPGVPSGTSAGSVDLSRGQSVGGNTERLPRIGEQVWSILQAAQLVPQGPIPV
jgi:hypothetical protein